MAEAAKPITHNHHGYIEFERHTFQDNIILCDAKSGILLGFGALVVLWCLDKLLTLGEGGPELPPVLATAETILYVAAIVALIATIGLTWRVIRPRISQADDYIYWGSKVFQQSEAAFITDIQTADWAVLDRDMLRQLHVLAGICRNKYANFRRAVMAAEISAALLLVALLIKVAANLVHAG
jgi:hypothetical protein